MSPSTGKRAVVYQRVSTGDQTTSNQQQDVGKVIADHGLTLTATFTDEGISGKKSRHQRPQYDAMLSMVERREVDVVVVWAADRLSRSTLDFLTTLQIFKDHDVRLLMVKQQFDTQSPTGKMILTVLAALAELESSFNSARTAAGIARVRRDGKPWGRVQADPEKKAQAMALLSAPQPRMGVVKIGKAVGLATMTVRTIWKQMQMEEAAKLKPLNDARALFKAGLLNRLNATEALDLVEKETGKRWALRDLL